MIKNCSDPVDVQDIHFKLHCQLKIFDNKELNSFATPHSLVACASQHGLLFVGTNSTNVQVILTSSLENYTPKDKYISDYPHRNISLPSIPKHLSVNCDGTILAVVIEQNKCPAAIFYDVLSFYKQNVHTLNTIRLSSSPGTVVSDINWNPAIPSFFTACKSDGSLGLYELKGSSVEINEIPAAAEVTSFCWSPKGKQIAVGSKKGTITQYKPDLKAVRMINAPILDEMSSLISLQWISNYQFIGIYQPISDSSQAKLIVVDAPKTGEPVFTNYDDICYSGSSRTPQFFMILQQQWNILFVASSNSAELAVLGLTPPDSWTQWIISDASRAELPLSAERQETLPIGLSLDNSNTKPYPWGETFLPPCPYILMLSHHGILCIFNLVNLRNEPSICTPATPAQDQSGLSQFVPKLKSIVPTKKNESELEFFEKPASAQTQKNIEIPLVTSQLPFQVKPPSTVELQTKNAEFSTSPSTAHTDKLFTFSPVISQNKSPMFGEKGLPLFDNISITPISKSQQTSSKNLIDGRYPSILSSLNAPQNTPTPFQTKPIMISVAPNKLEDTGSFLFPKAEEIDGSKSRGTISTKIDTAIMSKPDTNITPRATPDSSKIDTDAILKKMIREECVSLESELKAITQKGKMIDVNLGSETDKIEMFNIIKNLEEFLEEISEIIVGEHSEVHTLKQNLVLSWAWYEEALSRYNTSKNEMIKLLVKSQPLDSATEKRYSDIKKLIYYIESQFMQVSKALDEQWDKFQDYVKKTYKVQMPTMETIYQTMVRQNVVLCKQDYILKDISNQLKHKRRFGGGSLLLSVDSNQIEDQLNQLALDHHQTKHDVDESVMMQPKKLSSIKSKKLRELLKNREVIHVTTIKPFIPSDTFQSPKKRLSLLGAKMSPVSKILQPKQIIFSQSTPLRTFNVGSSNTNEIEVTQIKPINFEDLKQSSKVSDIITPLTKSSQFVSFAATTTTQLLPVNSNSAFAPTTQATFSMKETSAFTTTSSSQQKSSTGSFSDSKTGGLTKSIFTNDSEQQKPTPLMSSFGSASNKTQLSMSFTTATGNSTITVSTKTSSAPLFNIPKTTATFTTSSLISDTVNKPSKIVTATTNSSTGTTIPSSKTPTGFSISLQTPTISQAIPSFSNILEKPNVSPVNSGASFSFLSKTTTPVSNVNSVATSSLSPLGSISTATTASSLFVAQPFSLAFGSHATTTTTNSITSPIISPSITTSLLGYKNVTTASSIPKTLATTISALTSSNMPVATSSVISNPVVAPTLISSPHSVVTTSTFGSSAVSTGSSIFGTTTTASSFINSGASKVFSNITTAITMSSNSSSLFDTKPTGSLFCKSSASIVVSNPPSFGTTTSTQSPSPLFGTGISPATTISTSPTIFVSLATKSLPTDTAISSSTSIFTSDTLNVNSSTNSSPSVFGSNSSAPLFGSTSTVPSSTSIFANMSKTESTTKSSSIFGSVANSQISQPSIFGDQNASISTTKSIFGSIPTTTQASIFASTTTPALQGSVFGGSTSQGSIFGTPLSPSTTQPSIFGSTSSSIFPSTTAANNSPFGQSATFGSGFGSGFTSPLPTSSSGFGQQSSTYGTNTGSVFGSTQTTATTGSIFATNNSGSTFGAVSSAGSLFGSPAVSSSFNFASTPGTSGENALNFGGLNVGGTTTTAGSIFGGGNTFGSAATANPFGRTPEKTAFGGSNVFGTPTTTSSIFGSNTSTFGSNNQSTFSFASPTFGQQQQQQQSVFSQGTFGSTTFGNTQPGPFSSGGAAVAQSGFGSPTFQKPVSGFGGAPVFGGSPTPAFGGSPSFGGAPAFGSSPSFGSPTKVFGSNTATAAFGPTSSGTTGFDNLANQNTIGFGNLAKQATNAPNSSFSGSSSFSSWR